MIYSGTPFSSEVKGVKGVCTAELCVYVCMWVSDLHFDGFNPQSSLFSTFGSFFFFLVLLFYGGGVGSLTKIDPLILSSSKVFLNKTNLFLLQNISHSGWPIVIIRPYKGSYGVWDIVGWESEEWGGNLEDRSVDSSSLRFLTSDSVFCVLGQGVSVGHERSSFLFSSEFLGIQEVKGVVFLMVVSVLGPVFSRFKTLKYFGGERMGV